MSSTDVRKNLHRALDHRADGNGNFRTEAKPHVVTGLRHLRRNTTAGAGFNSTITSVRVVASDLPARTKNGTPSHRQESTCSRNAA